MKLVNLLIDSQYSQGYNKPPKLEASVTFAGPFGNLSTKLSDATIAAIVNLVTEEACRVAVTNASEIQQACNEAAVATFALTHEAEAS